MRSPHGGSGGGGGCRHCCLLLLWLLLLLLLLLYGLGSGLRRGTLPHIPALPAPPTKAAAVACATGSGQANTHDGRFMDGTSANEHACPQRSGAGIRCHTRPQRRPHTSCCRFSSSCCYRAACSHAPPSSLALAAQFVAHVPEQRALGDNDIRSVDGEPIPLDSRYWYYHGELLQAGALHAAAVALKRRQRGVGGLFSQLTLWAHEARRAAAKGEGAADGEDKTREEGVSSGSCERAGREVQASGTDRLRPWSLHA